ncbi:hypothetical protein PSACC_03747 [Paramicrosporidium saccamoebae]|uniref:Uncharacterized protein n=1 Tax=Paramicrosporidium saccamoebae TaxID=1246581 RepID=A0A2H9TFG9_9FUNG|nr:hypothetical protein PSACC_03747 [Paramicrosporidium saccamoebae]
MQFLFTAILAISAVSAHLTIIEPPMSRKMAGRVCKSYGLQLAELTVHTMQSATAELKEANVHEAWISAYNGKSPSKGSIMLKAGEVSSIGHGRSQKMKAIALCQPIEQQTAAPSRKASESMKKLQKRGESSSTPGKKYLRRLRPYQPPRVIDLGIRSFKLPEKEIHARAGIYGKSGSAKRARHISYTSSESSSSMPVKRKTMKNMKEKTRSSCKKKCRKTGRPSPFLSRVSSSSNSRSVSVEILFSQEDGALLGSCDQPAIVFHTRHYSRRLRISESSNSRSATQLDIGI